MQNEIMERRQHSSRPPRWRLTLLCGLLAVSIAAFIRFGPSSAAPATSVTAATPQSTAQAAGALVLAPTAHPPIPRTADELWLVPASAQNATRTALMTRFAEGVDAIGRDDYAAALPKVNDARLAKTPVADYASYYTALARLHTGRFAEARNDFNALNAARPPGVLREWGLLGEAEAADALGQFAEAARLYEMASMLKTSAPDVVLTRLARTLTSAGDTAKALATYRRVYYEFPLSELSDGARAQILQLTGLNEQARLRQDFSLELGRAQRLFGSKRYAESLTAFEALRPLADGDQRELVGLRIAEAQFYLGRYRQALDAARSFQNGSRKAEARFFALSSMRGLGDHESYVNEARRLVDQFPNDAWAEETLNNLGTHYILIDEDDTAITVFRDYLTRFPAGRYAQRAAWKVGWAHYRQQKYQDAIAVFEQAAATFPRSDYRPPYLYWTARAYDQLDKADAASSRYALIAVDYLNSYYGRLADTQLRKRGITAASQRRALVEKPIVGQSVSASPNAIAVPSSSSASASAPIVTPGSDGVGGTDTSGPGTGTPQQAQAENPAPTPAPAPASASAQAQAATSEPMPRELDARIRQLIAAGLYTPAIAELDFARRQWGPAPALEATLAWLYNAQGDLRRGINAMKRAYPQYLTDDGHRLPNHVQKVLFPVNYWPLIRRHAAERGLDPYLIAALVAQESTFDAGVRSSANAWGLMQVLPSTGRQLARSLKIRRFTTASLTNPDINVRLGTLYFQRLVKQFGGAHYALASYNAGENRVGRWINERPPLPQDEFIDDIPYAETQNYVKRILGTAEDYRRLYGN
jgi:soluble lytic murein transglycosylase